MRISRAAHDKISAQALNYALSVLTNGAINKEDVPSVQTRLKAAELVLTECANAEIVESGDV